MPWLKELLGSLKSGDHEGFMRNRELMEQFFLEHQKNRKAIQAIRVVDTRGQVLIKVKELKVIDKNKQHPYFLVASVGSLSEKNFFSELLKLRKGQVWMSNFELGIDNNEFCPPMIRIAAPITIKDNVIAGFLVINIWGQRIGEIVNNTITKTMDTLLLLRGMSSIPNAMAYISIIMIQIYVFKSDRQRKHSL